MWNILAQMGAAVVILVVARGVVVALAWVFDLISEALNRD